MRVVSSALRIAAGQVADLVLLDRWTYEGCTPLGAAWCVFELGPADHARTLAGERADLGEGRWLLLVGEQTLVEEDIGCARWSVLFCDDPWTGHAFAEAPAG